VVRCENALFDIIFYRKTIICQDRLGTRVERKRCKKTAFPQEIAAVDFDDSTAKL
jgi:hypothetical protein